MHTRKAYTKATENKKKKKKMREQGRQAGRQADRQTGGTDRWTDGPTEGEGGMVSSSDDVCRQDGAGDFFYNSDTKLFWVSFLDGMQRVLLFTEDLVVAITAQQVGVVRIHVPMCLCTGRMLFSDIPCAYARAEMNTPSDEYDSYREYRVANTNMYSRIHFSEAKLCLGQRVSMNYIKHTIY